jgi:hypothetical protein
LTKLLKKCESILRLLSEKSEGIQVPKKKRKRPPVLKKKQEDDFSALIKLIEKNLIK